ncbi:DUF418 domain-containing protein [uncultured Exiguobacterium sp.]|uniref:DUF418 domain-containing protein n=1 Tax=uncultured Exiguobacterium sp. TaxID=202669 RepID=UPI0025CDD358|nr:DUF418 domain-containing protein [uncultured Exiguobacterium sp.]
MQELKNERIQYLDILRGFALCGILFVNMPSFLGDRPHAMMGEIDQVIRLVFDLFIQTKFYTLFSVLFGAGFFLFIQRLRQKGLPNTIFARRLGILLVIGLVHLCIWQGDILHTYALTGFILLLFIKAKPITKLLFAIAFQFYAFLLYLLIFLGTREFGDAPLVELDETLQSFVASRDIIGFLSHRATLELPEALMNTGIIWPEILSLFLIGAYLMERFSSRPPTNRFLWWTLGISFLLTVPSLMGIIRAHADVADGSINLFYVWLSGRTLAITYACAVALLVRAGRMKWFAGLGRMALTNYLMHTLVFTCFIFMSGQYETTPLWQGLLLVFLLLISQGVASNRYLQSHPQGPMEKLWRKGTYGKKKR